uniref:Uncharacterized protein n=1 Tax=Anguilla anguilla TaxID=7936 RepID=A0A0E9WE57_ANGAN
MVVSDNSIKKIIIVTINYAILKCITCTLL